MSICYGIRWGPTFKNFLIEQTRLTMDKARQKRKLLHDY
jgi:hypothetical protein